jgi:hypothetical protein
MSARRPTSKITDPENYGNHSYVAKVLLHSGYVPLRDL